jgi:hypothetical protein
MGHKTRRSAGSGALLGVSGGPSVSGERPTIGWEVANAHDAWGYDMDGGV